MKKDNRNTAIRKAIAGDVSELKNELKKNARLVVFHKRLDQDFYTCRGEEYTPEQFEIQKKIIAASPDRRLLLIESEIITNVHQLKNQ